MNRKPKKQKSIILRLFIVGVCTYMAFTLAGLWNNLDEKKDELAALKEQQSEISNDIEELRILLESDSDKAIIEKAARERLGYIYSNEQVFIDVSGN